MSQLLAMPARNPDGTFMPGLSGQVYGEQRKLLEHTLRKTVMQDKAERLRNACERLLSLAANAEDDRVAMAAFSIIADRLDGKAVARIETSEGAPRDLGLAEIVALVLQHRKAEAIDSPVIDKTDDTSSI
jgi:hypothetical protein